MSEHLPEHFNAAAFFVDRHVAEGRGGRTAFRFARGRAAGYKVPRWIEFLPDLPKTATGKIQRFRLRAGA